MLKVALNTPRTEIIQLLGMYLDSIIFCQPRCSSGYNGCFVFVHAGLRVWPTPQFATFLLLLPHPRIIYSWNLHFLCTLLLLSSVACKEYIRSLPTSVACCVGRWCLAPNVTCRRASFLFALSYFALTICSECPLFPIRTQSWQPNFAITEISIT